MTAYTLPTATFVDAYSNFPAGQRRWDPYRSPPMDIDYPSTPYGVDRPSIGGLRGANLAEAKQLYRQAYRSMGGQDGLSPLELGHAAAYHAYYSSIRTRQLYDDVELERENLIGLAIAEASRLSRHSGRDININACTATLEAAARTACRIFAQARGAFDDEQASQSRYTTDAYTNPSGYEDFEMINRPLSRSVRGRSLSRTPHPTFADTAAVIPEMESGLGPNRIPLNSSYSDTSPASRYPPTPHPSYNQATRYPPMPRTPSSYSSAQHVGPGAMVAPYPGIAPSGTQLPQTYQAPLNYDNGAMVPAPRRRSSSFSSYQQQPMVPPVQGNYNYNNYPYGQYTAPPEQQTIILEKPKKHRHRHHHRHHHRSRSR